MRRQEDQDLTEIIKQIFEESRQTYGHRRIKKCLKEKG
ncbi:IS3 family transposase [Thermanaerosceptrum fracticalcis]